MALSSRRNPLTLMVLATLWEEPTHPYQVVQTLKARRKDRAAKLNYGSLYTVVGALERDGLIEAVGVTREGNLPPRTTYRVTEAGKTELIDWLTELVGEPQPEYPAYLAALSELPILPPDRARELLEQRVAALTEQQAALEQQAAASAAQLPELFSIEGQYLVALNRAELAFTRQLVERIRTGTLDGLPLWQRIHASAPDGGPEPATAAEAPTAPEEVVRRQAAEEVAATVPASGGASRRAEPAGRRAIAHSAARADEVTERVRRADGAGQQAGGPTRRADVLDQAGAARVGEADSAEPEADPRAGAAARAQARFAQIPRRADD